MQMHRRLIRATAAAGAALTLGVLYGAGGADAQPGGNPANPPVPNLTEISFQTTDPQITNVQCNINGQSSFDFHASGMTSQDQPFTETGTAVLGRQTNVGGGLFPDAAWKRIDAVFTTTIADVSGSLFQVEGEKHLRGADTTYNHPENEAVCATFPNPTAPLVSSGYAIGGTSNRIEYKAKISGPPPAGRPGKPSSCNDKGQSRLTFVDANYEVPSIPGASFNEKSLFQTFTSEGRCG